MARARLKHVTHIYIQKHTFPNGVRCYMLYTIYNYTTPGENLRDNFNARFNLLHNYFIKKLLLREHMCVLCKYVQY